MGNGDCTKIQFLADESLKSKDLCHIIANGDLHITSTIMDDFKDDILQQRFAAPSNIRPATKPESTHHRGSAGEQLVSVGRHHPMASNMHQKENQLNTMHEVIKNLENEIDDTRIGKSISKVHSLSTIRDIGCTNPMAFTLWHHPNMNENVDSNSSMKTGDSSSRPNHSGSPDSPDDRWTVHENWDLLNQLDSTYYAAAITKGVTVDNRVNDGSDWKNDSSSPLFLPVTQLGTTATIDGGTTTSTTATKDVLMDATAASATDTQPTSSSSSFQSPYNNNFISGTGSHRRHSLPDFISKPVAIRPSVVLPSASISSGLNKNNNKSQF